MEPRPIADAEGRPIRAHFSVAAEEGAFAIYLESRSRGVNDSHPRNPDYEHGLRLLIRRLSAVEADLLDVTIESLVTRDLPHEQKALSIGEAYPLPLSGADPEELRLRLQRAQRTVGQRPDATGSGNNTKRIRLLVRVSEPTSTVADLEQILALGIVDAVAVARDAAAVAAGRRGGQGYAIDSAARKAIEDHAMKQVRQGLSGQGWDVEDVHARESFDFRCRRDDREIHVEVKGLQGTDPEVILTANEVVHARSGADVRLAIVSGIKLTRSAGGAPRASRGVVTWFDPWDIDSGWLVPTQYRWRPG